MAENPNSEGMTRLPSFKGRLDMEDFRFAAGDSDKRVTTPMRRSTRISSTTAASSSHRQPALNKQALNPKARKRKAQALIDSPLSGMVSALSDAVVEADPAESAASSIPIPGTSQKKKRSRQKSGYAPPSTYAHLPLLPDALVPNLLVLFIGLNPGIRTAQTGHAYNHPSNLFWKLMYSSGVLPVRCTAEEDRTLPARFSLGLTNIVARPSRNGAELSKAEMDEGVNVLEDKIRRWRPEAVCVVGKSIWESVWRVRHGKGIGKHEFKYGWQDDEENMGRGDVEVKDKIEGTVYAENWVGAKVFVASSTSGLAATLRPEEKERIWRELGLWVQHRRVERQVQGTA